jgi:hypothetical protein
MTADTIELELPRPFGSLIFWKQIKLKLPATQGPRQLQFNCLPFLHTSLFPLVPELELEQSDANNLTTFLP